MINVTSHPTPPREDVEEEDWEAHCVRACVIEMHVKVSQEPLYKEIYWENAAAQSEHPDQAPASTVRTPQCRYTVWGKAPKRHQNTQAPCRAHGN